MGTPSQVPGNVGWVLDATAMTVALLLQIMVLILMVFGALWLYRTLAAEKRGKIQPRAFPAPVKDVALEIIRRRFARGKINLAEYRLLRDALAEDAASTGQTDFRSCLVKKDGSA